MFCGAVEVDRARRRSGIVRTFIQLLIAELVRATVAVSGADRGTAENNTDEEIRRAGLSRRAVGVNHARRGRAVLTDAI